MIENLNGKISLEVSLLQNNIEALSSLKDKLFVINLEKMSHEEKLKLYENLMLMNSLIFKSFNEINKI